MLIILVN